MMKPSAFFVLSIFLLAACTVLDRISTSEKNGLKSMHLIQSLQPSYSDTDRKSEKPPGWKINASYKYQEKTMERPMVLLDLKINKGNNNLPDSTVFINLDGENIPLSSLKQEYIIPENLWVSVIHSQNIQYQLHTNHNMLIFSLNEKQKKQLIEFFHRAIKYRDDIFPAIPPGQKKW